MKSENRIIIASASPRRRELAERIGYPFTCEPSNAEEIIPEGLRPEDTAEYLAGRKAEDVAERHRDEPVTVIGADTIVLSEGTIFGKPADEQDAYRMLRSLSGREHEVRTGVCIIRDGRRVSFTSSTKVYFYELSDEEILSYIRSGEPMDKAGAYGIQGGAVRFVRRIDGDYNNVVGFPLGEIIRQLEKL